MQFEQTHTYNAITNRTLFHYKDNTGKQEAVHRLLVAAGLPPPCSEADRTLMALDDRRLETSIQKGRSDTKEKRNHTVMAASPASPHLELWKDPCMAVECSTLEEKRERHHDVGHAASHARDTLVDPAVQRLETVPIDVVCEYCKSYMLLLMLNVLLFCFVHIVYCMNINKMLLSTHLALLGNWSLFVVQMGDKSFDLFEYILEPCLLTWINFNPSID